MMNKAFAEAIRERELTFRELFVGAYDLMRGRFKEYCLLTVLIFLPSNLLVELLLQRMPQELTLESMYRVSILQGLVSIYSMIALSTCTVMVKDAMEETEKGFFPSLSEGIRAWLRFLLTLVCTLGLVIAGFFVLILLAAGMPMLLVPAITAVIILSVLLVLFLYGSCIFAAANGSILKANLEQVRQALKDHMGRSLGLMLLIFLLSILLTTPAVSMTAGLGELLGQPIAGAVINALIETVVSILNIYVDISMILRFFNLDAIKNV